MELNLTILVSLVTEVRETEDVDRKADEVIEKVISLLESAGIRATVELFDPWR